MDYCTPRGIPHSEFLRWRSDDRAKALAWQLRQAQTCGGCGTRPEEWQESQGGHRYAYRAEHVRCRGCEVRAQGESSLPKNAGRGIHVVLRRNLEVSLGADVGRDPERQAAR